MSAFKNTAPIVWLLISIAVFAGGMIMLLDVKLAWNMIITSISIMLVVVGIMYLSAIFLKKGESKFKELGIGILSLLGGVFTYLNPQYLKVPFSFAIGMLGIIIGCFVLLSSIKLKKDGASWVWTLLVALVYIGLGINMAFLTTTGRIFGIIFGVYLIFFALNIFGDALVSLMKHNDGAKKAKKHIRVTLPLVFAAFLPMRMLKKVNALVQEEPDALLLLEDHSIERTTDMEIFIHTKEGLIPGMGHVDAAIGECVYSYGNYDDSTWKLGGFLADGVLVEMPKTEHVKQALKVEKKILMGYGLALTPEQKKGVQEQLDDLLSHVLPWEPKAEQADKGEIKGNAKDFEDVSSQLYNDAKASFYKFKQGNEFKTYYALGTNCVKLVDTLVGKTGIDLIKINGIITPGAYLDYLDRLYDRGDSIVVSRTLYQDIENKREKEITVSPA
ncbi:HdeD family acid-resistance protein [Acetobacterium sp. KB-1]|uniref:HdeD family acid-resistance protein n=1 Tax=Acetobacterium sp. KB-1 TaxID=2184575 RepID=UPI000DBEC5C6|nr:MFS transporter [Acetobacterium sp. KB-1]AWW28630.1 MFS transporter [Acetobacterium sp. KB-1]